MPDPHIDLEQLVRQVQNFSKYSQISPDLIRSLLVKELAKRPGAKEAVKATRNKLHQVGTAYQDKPLPYANWMAHLTTLPDDLTSPAVHDFLLSVLPAHSSTRERLGILPVFFKECLANLGEVDSIVDIACGLNPFCIPWMPLKPGFTYFACDIFSDMVDFLNAFFEHFHIRGQAAKIDVTRAVPDTTAELALVLKTIPCLEQIDKDAGRRLLFELRSPNLLVSFPARSLGGRSKGMLQNYELHFRELVSGQPWRITRFEFPGELAFLVQK